MPEISRILGLGSLDLALPLQPLERDAVAVPQIMCRLFLREVLGVI